MRKTVTFMKKAATLAAVLAVFALAISVAWGAVKSSWDNDTKTLIIHDWLTTVSQDLVNPRLGYLHSGIYQLLSSTDGIPGFTLADVKSVKTIIISTDATQASPGEPADLYSGYQGYSGIGGLITWEDMAYLGSSDIWESLEVIDMSHASTVKSAELRVANSNDNGMVFAKVREIRLPNGIAVISKDSFIEPGVLPLLEYIQFPPTLTDIYDSFHGVGTGTDKPLMIVFTGDVPPAISDDAFPGVVIGAVLIPNGGEDVYTKILPSRLGPNIVFVRSIDVDEQQRVLTTLPTGTLSVDVTVSGQRLELISDDIRIEVDGVSFDKPLEYIAGKYVAPGVVIPRNENTDRTDERHTLTVLLNGTRVPDVSVTVTVKPVPIDPNKITLTLYTTESYRDGIGTLEARAWLRLGESPYPNAVRVHFVVNGDGGGYTSEGTRSTGVDGRTESYYVTGLPKGWYHVTAWAEVESDAGLERVVDGPKRVGIGIGQDATEPTETGGCSAAASPLLLIAGLAAMAWTSKKR
ncbi:MAG: hypothetical protein LBL73_12795 [Synergistaceae bacterium]|jgi:hypothetical protein|nr:hypothetical protein [Synergistaceae bacterium]